jgi:predicted AAA+ superfamily ATPase
MKTFTRIIPLEKILKRKSIILLGPRRTGKSYFLKNQIKPDRIINLLEADTYRNFSSRPELLREVIQKDEKIIAIDEIQKAPMLMDEVHALIESRGLRFILTGSSARKLARSHTSLMAGRAKMLYLHPLVSAEIENYELDQILSNGSLPIVFNTEDPWDELKDYAGIYLREEILAEALVRKIENFSRFIDFAAMTSGQLLNFESIARDAQVPARTIREYYSLLEDTLMGYTLAPIKATAKRKCISSSKFYFFDIGVMNSILGRKSIAKKTKEYGYLFEHFIFLELKAYIDYFSSDSKLSFWRVDEENEVDFVVNEKIAIEVKATELVIEKHLKGLVKFSMNGPVEKKIVVSLDKNKRTIGDVEVYPYDLFLKELWDGKIFK